MTAAPATTVRWSRQPRCSSGRAAALRWRSHRAPSSRNSRDRLRSPQRRRWP